MIRMFTREMIVSDILSLALKICLSRKCSLWGRFISATVVNFALFQPVYAQEVNLESFCRQSSSPNFPCSNNKQLAQQNSEDENSSANKGNETMRVRLDVSGPNDEWIRMDIRDDTRAKVIRAYHTTRVRRQLLSRLVRGAISFGVRELLDEVIDDGYDGPVPVPPINFYRWADHKRQRIAFIPDGCLFNTLMLGSNEESGATSCVILGTESVALPLGTNIRAGLFMIEYTERNLVRSITFRLPENKK
jgi:hypothetical protein